MRKTAKIANLAVFFFPLENAKMTFFQQNIKRWMNNEETFPLKMVFISLVVEKKTEKPQTKYATKAKITF